MTILRWLFLLPLQALGLAVVWTLKLLSMLIKEALKFIWRHKRTKVHGDADWATMKQLKDAGHTVPGGFMVGHLGKPIYAHTESSLLSFGQRGSGKSQGMAASLRLERTNTLIVIDPAGELCRAQRPVLEAAGYTVRHIDLMRPAAGFSPMTFFRESTSMGFNRDVALFCGLAMEEGQQSEVGRHFIETSRNLLGAVIAAEITEYKVRNTLAQCVEILSADGPQKRRLYFEGLRKLSYPLIRMGVHSFEEAGDREKGSFSTTMARKLRPWLDPAIVEACRDDSWTLEDMLLSPSPQAVFVTAGVGLSEVTAPFMRMIVGLAVATVERLFNRTRQALPRGLRIYVDEADLIGNCRPIVSAVTELRKAGVNVWLNYQSIAQLQKNFGNEDARTLQSNCDWLISGGMKDDKLYDEVSRMIGDYTETGTSTSRNQSGKGESEHDFARRRIKPDELRRLPNDEIVALLGSLSVKMKKSFSIVRNSVRFR